MRLNEFITIHKDDPNKPKLHGTYYNKLHTTEEKALPRCILRTVIDVCVVLAHVNVVGASRVAMQYGRAGRIKGDILKLRAVLWTHGFDVAKDICPAEYVWSYEDDTIKLNENTHNTDLKFNRYRKYARS